MSESITKQVCFRCGWGHGIPGLKSSLCIVLNAIAHIGEYHENSHTTPRFEELGKERA